MSKAADFSNEARTAAREQILVNTRLTALQAALDVMQLQGFEGRRTIEERIAMAQKVEDYIKGDLESFKKPSALVIQSNMPPAGAFRPGR